MQRALTYVHTSPAAIGPLMQFYSMAEPEWEITNLLDDGILRFLKNGQPELVEERLREMLASAGAAYKAEAVLITCSSVPSSMVRKLSGMFPMPLLKIDGPMARRAVKTGSRIGVAVTFAPTQEPTRRLLIETAAEENRPIELDVEVIEGAYDALLTNDFETHDRLLIEGCERLAARHADAIVLAQVSMARAEERIRGRVNAPVYSSLSTSLESLRDALAVR